MVCARCTFRVHIPVWFLGAPIFVYRTFGPRVINKRGNFRYILSILVNLCNFDGLEDFRISRVLRFQWFWKRILGVSEFFKMVLTVLRILKILKISRILGIWDFWWFWEFWAFFKWFWRFWGFWGFREFSGFFWTFWGFWFLWIIKINNVDFVNYWILRFWRF